MAILPKANYRFNPILSEFPQNSSKILKDNFQHNMQTHTGRHTQKNKPSITKNRIAKTILSDKTIVRGIAIPDVKLFYRVLVIKNKMVLAQNKQIDQ